MMNGIGFYLTRNFQQLSQIVSKVVSAKEMKEKYEVCQSLCTSGFPLSALRLTFKSTWLAVHSVNNSVLHGV